MRSQPGLGGLEALREEERSFNKSGSSPVLSPHGRQANSPREDAEEFEMEQIFHSKETGMDPGTQIPTRGTDF